MANEENIKSKDPVSHNIFLENMTSSINKYITTIVEEKTKKYEKYDETINFLHNLPFVKEYQNKIHDLEKRIHELENKGENITLTISEKFKEVEEILCDKCDKELNIDIKHIRILHRNINDLIEQLTLCAPCFYQHENSLIKDKWECDEFQEKPSKFIYTDDGETILSNKNYGRFYKKGFIEI